MSSGAVIPILKGGSGALAKASHQELMDIYAHYRKMSAEWLRRQIIDHNRIDILATAILGYEIHPFHLRMLQHQFANPQSMILVYRGAGKSTVCTIAKCIHYLCKNRDFRILLASKTTGNAQGFLKEIKGHLEQNVRLIEVFGEFYDPRKCEKWDNQTIEIVGRRQRHKESTITCAGVDGTIVSKHYDIIMSDDLVDEDNSRTEHMRKKTQTWYYKTLDPCLEPPDPEVPHRGEHHHLGTRYHFADLYGHLLENELSQKTLILPALDELGRSPWPEKHPPSWFAEKKRKSGIVIFESQYQCKTEAMKGEVFSYDDCQTISDKDIPSGLRKFLGIDLAISQKETSAEFAMVLVGLDREERIFVLDFYLGRLTFPQQIRKSNQFYDKHDPIRGGVESNAYQEAFRQQQKEMSKVERKLRRWIGIHTDKDKMTRAWKLTPYFEDGRVFFRKGMERLIDQFVLFPNARLKDGVDAFDIALRSSKRRRKRKRRESEPGLL